MTQATHYGTSEEETMTGRMKHLGRFLMRQARAVFPIAVVGVSLAGLSGAQVVANGAGAYTKTLPSGAVAPTTTIYTTQTGPVATHKYWSSKLWTPLNNNGGFNMIPQPLFTTATATGMSIGIHGNVDGYPANDATATAFYQYPNFDLTIGESGLNATSVKVSASSDWSADFYFSPSLTIRTGRGMPFAYALTDGTPTTVTFARTPTVLINNKNVLAVSTPEGDSNFTNYYGLFCPAGGAWVQSGMTFTCTAPSGSNYMSVALLPGLLSGSNGNQTTIATQLADYTKVAFSFPTNTQVSWSYNESSSTVSTTYTITTKSMDGTSAGFLTALYPTQYDAMAAAVNTPYLYLTNHGVMKVNSGTSFTVTDTFHGILPMMPPTSKFNLTQLKGYVDAFPGASLQASDYEQGKVLGATAQILPLAQIADKTAYTTLQTGLQNTLQTWFTATPTSQADEFYYDSVWGTMIGYPASFDSDDQLNDHHFHYGYFIHAAAINGLFNPSWISNTNYGGMVRLLQQDIGNYDRTNAMFPFLRHFDVYAGHSWASGQAPFADGENEESSSEAVNAWTGMILLGAATGDTTLRDAGIWLYTQETKSVAYYWLNERPSWVNVNAATTFPSWFAPLRVANQFDDKGDTGTFFGANPDFEHAIEFLPFTGGSLHLGLSPSYVQSNYAEDVAANAAAKEPAGDWPDLMAEYEALSNPATALTQWSSVTAPTDGDSLAHEYAWIMSLQTLGQVDANVTANTPFYAVFNNAGAISHVAFNPSTAPINVTFSDGAALSVPASTMLSDNPLITSFTFSTGVATVQPPAAPVGVTAVAKSSSEIDLSWTLASGVTYTVFRGTVGGFVPTGANAIATGLTAASFADTTASASTTYYYVVEAVNSGGSSAPSAQVSATTSAGSNSGGLAETNILYLVGGASTTNPGLLSFTKVTSGVDSIPANVAASIGTVTNPLTYTITGVSGTYNNAAQTAFDMYIDAGTNAGEGVQMEVLYDLTGSGTFNRTELYSMFATNAAIDFEDYNQSARGGLSSSVGTLGNMTNGTIVIKIWDALPGVNDAPISLSVGNNTAALSNLVIPFTGITLAVAPAQTPTGLTATAVNSSAINVKWNASSTVGVTYSLFRSTTSGFTPSAGNMIASGLSGTSYSDVNLSASTTYNYAVEAVNALGSSAPSTQASATTPAQVGAIAGSNTLFLVAGATAANSSLLSFVGGPANVDMIPVNNPQSPDVVANPLVYVITGLNGTYDNTKSTAFDMLIDAGTNPGEAAQVEVLYDLTGTGTYARTELYHYFGTDPVLGYEDYNQASRGGLETGTGTLGNMTNGTIVIKVWEALPGPNAGPIALSVGSNPSALSSVVIPFNNVTQSPAGPAAPTSVAATAKSSTEIDLAWTASTTNNATYKIYRSLASGFTPSSSNMIATATGTTYADTTLVANTTYYYIVSSTNSSGTTAGVQVSATTLAIPTTTSLSLSSTSVFLGGTEVLTSSVTPAAATGSITFKDGSSVLSTVKITGTQTTYTTAALTGGTHSFTATYSGDSVYATSVSAAQTVNVPLVPPDFTVAASPANALVGAGGSATYTLSFTPLGGFNSAITFSCSGLPALSTCAFSPSTVTLNGTTAATTMMTVTTNGTSKAMLRRPAAPGTSSQRPIYFAFVSLGVGLLFVGRKRRALVRKLAVSGLMLAFLGIFNACSSSAPQTPTSINTITVTATSGSTSHTLNVTLDVQQY